MLGRELAGEEDEGEKALRGSDSSGRPGRSLWISM